MSQYQHQPDFDASDHSSNHDNTSCLDSKSQFNDEALCFDYVKKKIRALQNSIENDLSELSLQTVGLNKPDDYNFQEQAFNDLKYDNAGNYINWSKINAIKARIESDICKASNYLNKVKSNLSPADNIQVMRYSEIFDQYRKDFNSIISNAENKHNDNILFSTQKKKTDNLLSPDDSPLLFEQNKALNNSLFDIESLTHEALNILNTSKKSNEKFIRIRNKMYSIIDMHLPDIDMIQKNIMHLTIKNQRIIAATIAICIFLIILAAFR